MGEGGDVSTEDSGARLIVKESMGQKDLPQDYSPFSPSSPDNLPKDSPAGVCSTADAHAWVSPNKSDEAPSFKESSPDVAPEKPVIQEDNEPEEQLNAKDSTSPTEKILEAVDFEPIATEAESDFDFIITGESLEIQKNDASFISNEVVLVPRKDVVKITHGGKEIMLVLPSESCRLDSTLELSEILAASFNMTDDIVGLKTTALVVDDESFKHHGDIVIPFSSLISGQLSALLHRDGNGIEGIPSFNLVTFSLDSCIEKNLENSARAGLDESQSKASLSDSVEEGILHTEAFLKLMANSTEFNPFEKNSLLRFGVDNSEQAGMLYGAAFRVAVYTGDMTYFVQGLKGIAKILPGTEPYSLATDDISDGKIAKEKPTSMTIFGLTDFVISTDELFDSTELTAQEYVTLLNAIFLGHSSVQSLFELYHDPDFLIACDTDEGLCHSLCMRDLLHLGKKLVLEEPLQPQSQSQFDEDRLKWAIKTGLHNFAATMSTEVPQEFINIIYHMFSSGDEMVLAACNRFVDMDDSDPVEEMLSREWHIFCRNKAFQEKTFVNTSDQHPAETSVTASDSSCKSSDSYAVDQFPNILRTAMVHLVDSDAISEEKAVTLMASFSEGNQLLRDIYDHFIQYGDVDDFLNMLKAVAVPTPTNSPHHGRVSSCQDVVAAPSHGLKPDKEVVVSVANDTQISAFQDVSAAPSVTTEATDDAFQKFFMENASAFGDLEIAALRLAGVRKDPELAQALVDFRDGKTDSILLYKTLLNLAKSIIEEVDEVEPLGQMATSH